MRRLRIAVYHNLHSGGAKRVTAEHLRRLSQQHDVALFTLNTADAAFAVNGAAAWTTAVETYVPAAYWRSPFGRLNPIIGMHNVRRMDATCRHMAEQMDAGGYDVVLAHPCQMTQAPLILNWLRTPALYYCHELPRRVYEPEVPRPYNQRSARRIFIDRFDPFKDRVFDAIREWDGNAALKATRILANSQFTRANAERAYRRAVDVCPPGVDADEFQPRGLPRESFVLSVGALTPSKGFDFIIQALATIAVDQRPPLVIISNYQEPRELAYLSTLAAQSQVQVTFKAGVSEAELRDWYARAGCMAYAPVREPFGLAALEAMAAGAPVIGVNEGGVRETIVDGVSGVLAPRNVALFGQRIVEMLRNPQRAERFAVAARKHVLSRFTWAGHMEMLESWLDDTAKARSSSAPRAASALSAQSQS